MTQMKQQMKYMKTSQHTANQLGLQTLKMLVILMMFAAVTVFFAGYSTNALEESFSLYESPEALFATIKN